MICFTPYRRLWVVLSIDYNISVEMSNGIDIRLISPQQKSHYKAIFFKLPRLQPTMHSISTPMTDQPKVTQVGGRIGKSQCCLLRLRKKRMQMGINKGGRL